MINMYLVIFGIQLLHIADSEVNINNDGSAWMCNHNPESSQIISPLPIIDQQRIRKLEQIQVFHRHGSRVGSHRISSFLPESNLKYDCDITSVVSRQYQQQNEYQNHSNPFVTLRKQYVIDEQAIEGNCQRQQSLKYLIPQQQANAHHLQTAYIGNEPFHLFNSSTLYDIAQNLAMKSQDERVALITTDKERTVASLMVIASELFNFNELNNMKMTINVETHDLESDPYHPDDNTICIEHQQFGLWNDAFSEDPKLQNTAANEIIHSDIGNSTISAFIKEGGVWTSNKVGIDLLYPYCNGMTLPLSNVTFWNTVHLSYQWAAAHITSPYAIQQMECYNQFMNIPVLDRMRRDIESVEQSGIPRMVIHSVHDTTIIRLLQSLGMYDYQLIIFGEMVTFEVYSMRNEDSLYFRFLRKGHFVPYPHCEYLNGSEICDLKLMMEHSFKNVVNQSVWADQLCGTLLTDCRCGYCHPQNEQSNSTSDRLCEESHGSLTLWIGIAIGIIGGSLCTVILIVSWKKCPIYKERNPSSHIVLEDTVDLKL